MNAKQLTRKSLPPLSSTSDLAEQGCHCHQPRLQVGSRQDDWLLYRCEASVATLFQLGVWFQTESFLTHLRCHLNQGGCTDDDDFPTCPVYGRSMSDGSYAAVLANFDDKKCAWFHNRSPPLRPFPKCLTTLPFDVPA